MSEIKPIKTRKDYDEAVALLSALIAKSPEPDTPEDIQIDILGTLIDDYESAILPDYDADPIEAIKLRIEQLGLKEVDLVPYLGSRSRVSEILSGTRTLTVTMIKNLEEGLGIPASILVGSNNEKKTKRWNANTLALMARRGYFGDQNKSLSPKSIRESGLLRTFFSPQPVVAALLRQTNYRDISTIDKYHMDAWANKVLTEASDITAHQSIPKFDHAILNETKLSNLFKLSVNEDGVLDVIHELYKLGIVVIIEPHPPSTRLDGATFFTDKNPVIGLTLRHDRLDNFWFTLAHELAHVYLDYDSDFSAFYDQLFSGSHELSKIESNADKLAGNLLIPEEEWKVSPLRYASTPTLVKSFAKKVGVHESIVAGRIRHDTNNWLAHNDIVNEQSVRASFKDKLW